MFCRICANQHTVHDSLFAALSVSHAFTSLPACRIAFVGAGGKTSSIRRLSGELLNQAGMLSVNDNCLTSVLCTTTTKLMHEHQMVYGYENVLRALDQQPIVWGCARLDKVLNKGLGFSGAEVINLSRHCLWTLVEADGSKHMPLKIFGKHEPVIDFSPHGIILVAGLSALDRPISEVLFRTNEAVLHDDMRSYMAQHGPLCASTKLTHELFFVTIASQLSSLRSIGVPCSILLNQADCCANPHSVGAALDRYVHEKVLDKESPSVDIIVGSVYDTP